MHTHPPTYTHTHTHTHTHTVVVRAVVSLSATVRHEVLADLPPLLLGHIMAVGTLFALHTGGERERHAQSHAHNAKADTVFTSHHLPSLLYTSHHLPSLDTSHTSLSPPLP